MSAATATINYSRILERRPRAVQLDIGEAKPVWFPLGKITLDEANYTVTAPQALMREKLAESQGAAVQYNPFNNRLVKLAAPSWENEKAIGIDVVVSRMTGSRDGIRDRVFFSKAQIVDGAAPLWLVNQKEQALLAKLCKSGHYAPEQFTISGLRAKSRMRAAPDLQPAPTTAPDLCRTAQKAFNHA